MYKWHYNENMLWPDDAADPEARGAPSVRVTSADARALGGAVADPSQAETISQLCFYLMIVFGQSWHRHSLELLFLGLSDVSNNN